MVIGHTLDALLATSAREAPALVLYWKARGLTAPVFMMASGWAISVAVARSGRTGLGVVRGRLPRVLALLAIGYALRWPGWAADPLGGDPAVRAHLLAFDALHAIAISLLGVALVLGLLRARSERALALALLAVAAVALGMRGPAPLAVVPAALPGSLGAMALVQAAGGTSPFPVFPWVAYFAAGAIVGLLAGEGERRAFGAIAAVGGALVLATAWTGVGRMPAGHPALVAFRMGAVLLLFAVLSRVPRATAARLAPLGRASLAVYALHLPVVYGWSTMDGLAQRVGPRLPLAAALAVSAGLLAACLLARRTAALFLPAAAASARFCWRRRAALAAAVAALRRARAG